MEQPNFEPTYEPFNIDEFIQNNKDKLASEPPPDKEQILKNAVDGKQGNGFILTYNNFRHTPDEFMQILQSLPFVSRVNFQIEKGQGGTIHYQAYIHTAKRVLWGQIRRRLIKADLHQVAIENRFASPQNADEYCSKVFQEIDDKKVISPETIILTDDDGKKWFQTKIATEYYSWGKLDTRQGKRTDLDDFVQSVLDGASDSELAEQYPKLYMLHKNKINGLRQSKLEQFKIIDRQIKISFVYGETGTYKTTYVKQKYPANVRYTLMRGKDPFFNYDGQEVIFFDEFNPSKWEIEYLNELLDRSPMNIFVRYGSRTACYTTVIFASNTAFENVYAELRNGNQDEKRKYNALMRRIENIYNFDNPTDRQKFLDDVPTGNPFYIPPSKTEICKQTGMRILTPEEQKDLPF